MTEYNCEEKGHVWGIAKINSSIYGQGVSFRLCHVCGQAQRKEEQWIDLKDNKYHDCEIKLSKYLNNI